MHRIFLLTSLITLSLNTHALVTFQPGDVATAKAFNDNFQELKNDIQELSSFYTPNGFANGVPAKIIQYSANNYSVFFDIENSIAVDRDGMPRHGYFYFIGENCFGEPYENLGFPVDDSRVGDTYSNPAIFNSSSLSRLNDTIYDGIETEVDLLHSKSQYINGECRNLDMSIVGAKAKPYTGDLSFPLIITGIGVPFEIADELGVPPDDSANSPDPLRVWANGQLIGTTTDIPSGSDSYVRVKLNEYESQTISLRPDGSYYGFSLPTPHSATLNYTEIDCEGQPYVEHATDLSFWDQKVYSEKVVSNNGAYYILGINLYKMTGGPSSRRFPNGTCTNSVSEGLESYSFRKAEFTTTPQTIAPVFELPIEIEGFNRVTVPVLEEAM